MEETVAPVIQTSVLIVSRNCEAALRRCLTALEASVGRETFEILVMDNGSRDASSRMDEEFPSITPLRMPRNFGWTKAMNIGLRTAVGELVLFLDPNVEVSPDTVRVLSRRLLDDEDATALYAALASPGGGLVPMERNLPTPAEPDPQFRSMAASDGDVPLHYPGARALMVRKRFVTGMNYFDERYGQFWADAEICFQVRRAGKQILMLPAARATWHEPAAASEPKAYKADRILGLSRYLSKHFGFWAGASMRIGAVLKALVTFQLGVFFNLVTGQKVDGSHE